MHEPKEWYDPESWYRDFLGEEIETERPDPYDRPDFAAEWPQEEEETPLDCDPVTGLPLLPCAVCGVHTIPEGGMAYTCPVCGWQADASVQDEWEPSACNDGLSLLEARLNFRTFGWSNPAMLIEGEETNDAEF